MKNTTGLHLAVFTISIVCLFSCHKKDGGSADTKLPLRIEFQNVIGQEDIRLNTGSYTNSSGETYSITSLQYFISNIAVQKTTGEAFIVPQDSSYFLINESAGNPAAVVSVPEGEYNRISFIVGVDSLRSTMDISKRTGALTPGIGTYWNENQGYVFFSFEGQSSDAPGGRFRFQVGGYGGKTSPTFNNLRLVAFDLTAGNARVRPGTVSAVRVKADISKVFTGASEISIAANPIVGFEPFSVNIANNYQQMFYNSETVN